MASKERKENLEAIQKDVNEMSGTLEEIKVYAEILKNSIERVNRTLTPHINQVKSNVEEVQASVERIKGGVDDIKTLIGKNK